MTKRIIALALALLMIVTLFTACGNKEKPAVSPNPSTAIAGEDNSTEAVVPSIDADEGTTESTTAADAGTATTVAGDKNTGKPSSADKSESKPTSTGKPAQKPVTTTKPSGGSPSSDKPSSADKPNSSGKPESKPTTTRPAETTTKPAPKPVETTTKPSSSGTNPTSTQFSYFRASTGEKIRYTSYDVDYGKCTPSESNGVITFTYANGVQDTKMKCDNCGKYLCEGCEEWDVSICSVCGRKDCIRYSHDVTCYLCGKSVKGGTCHYCPNKR